MKGQARAGAAHPKAFKKAELFPGSLSPFTQALPALGNSLAGLGDAGSLASGRAGSPGSPRVPTLIFPGSKWLGLSPGPGSTLSPCQPGEARAWSGRLRAEPSPAQPSQCHWQGSPPLAQGLVHALLPRGWDQPLPPTCAETTNTEGTGDHWGLRGG